MELIQNGDFESGSLEPGWMITGPNPEGSCVEEGGIGPGRYKLSLRFNSVAEQLLHDAGYAHDDLRFYVSRILRSEFMTLGVRIQYSDESQDLHLFTFMPHGAEGWVFKTVPVSRTLPVRKISFESHSLRIFHIDNVTLNGTPAYQVLTYNQSRMSVPFNFPLYPLGQSQMSAQIPPLQSPDAMQSVERRLTRIEGRMEQLVDMMQQYLRKASGLEIPKQETQDDKPK